MGKRSTVYHNDLTKDYDKVCIAAMARQGFIEV